MSISEHTLTGPLALLLLVKCSRLLWSAATKKGGAGAEEAAVIGPEMVRELRRYVCRNGHFVLVDIESHDGEIIKISV